LIVGSEFKESIRSHHDLSKNNAPHYAAACKFYSTLADLCSSNHHIIDLFASSLDQVGLAEMKVCVERTGGYLIQDDSFTHGVFQGSLSQVFSCDGNFDSDMLTF